LARILERDKAEYFGPSGRFEVGGFGFWISVATTTSDCLISTMGSATFSILLFSLPLPLLLLLLLSLTFSTIE
jgi:hypothetical protein